MGQQSQDGQIGFKTQAVAGVFEDPGAVAPDEGVFAKTRGGALAVQRSLIDLDPEIGGDRDQTPSALGPASHSGDIEFYGRMQFLATLLSAAFGSVVSVPTGVTQGVDLVGTHTITPLDGGSLPILSVEQAIGASLETFRYTDAVVNTINLEVAPDGYLMGTAGLIAPIILAGATRTAVPATDLTPVMVGTNMTVTLNSVTTDIVRSLSLDFTNNFEDDVFELGSVGLADLTPKRRELTFSMTIRATDITLWREAVFGSAGATSPTAGAASTVPLVITIDTFAAVGTGVADKFSFTLTMDNVHIEPFELSPSGDDVIEYDISFRAVRAAGSVLATAVIVNDQDEVK